MGAVSNYQVTRTKEEPAELTEKFFRARIFDLEEYLKICHNDVKSIVRKSIEINQSMLERIQ